MLVGASCLDWRGFQQVSFASDDIRVLNSSRLSKACKINILNASFLAMHRAVDQLKTTPELLIIDGNRFNPYPNIAHECIIKGDAKYLSKFNKLK